MDSTQPPTPDEWEHDLSAAPASDPGVPGETAVDYDEYAIDVTALFMALVSVSEEVTA